MHLTQITNLHCWTEVQIILARALCGKEVPATLLYDQCVIFGGLIFTSLFISRPAEQPVIVLEHSTTSVDFKRAFKDALVCGLKIESVMFLDASVLAAIGAGKHTALIVDVGWTELRLIPVAHGRSLAPLHFRGMSPPAAQAY